MIFYRLDSGNVGGLRLFKLCLFGNFQGDNLRNSLLVRYFDKTCNIKQNSIEMTTSLQNNTVIFHGPGGMWYFSCRLQRGKMPSPLIKY